LIHARPKAGDHVEPLVATILVPLVAGHIDPGDADREPDVDWLQVDAGELRRGDAYDDVPLLAEIQLAADSLAVAGELPAPKLM
jgi:hypothetical protein